MPIDLILRSLSNSTSTASLLVIVLSLIGTAVLLPGNSRRALLGTLFLFVPYVVTCGIREALPTGSAAQRPLGLVARFLFLCVLGRASFLLLTHVLLSKTLAKTPKLFLDVAHASVYLAALTITLWLAGLSPSSLLASSLLLTLVLGISLHDSLGNLIAGMSLQVRDALEVGDWIQFNDNAAQSGRVTEINWRATVILTLELVEIHVPHVMLSRGAFVNISRPELHARRSIYFHAPFGVSPQQVHDVVLTALRDTRGVMSEPRPSIVTLDFDERGVRYWVRYFISEQGRRNGIDSSVRDRVWYALHRAGAPFPLVARAEDLVEAIKAESSARAPRPRP